jgi:hypothetical protein
MFALSPWCCFILYKNIALTTVVSFRAVSVAHVGSTSQARATAMLLLLMWEIRSGMFSKGTAFTSDFVNLSSGS